MKGVVREREVGGECWMKSKWIRKESQVGGCLLAVLALFADKLK